MARLWSASSTFTSRTDRWPRFAGAPAAQGNGADALRAYDRLATLLREELGLDPSPQTRELHRELLT